MNKKYYPEHIDFIREHIEGTSYKDLSIIFNKKFNMNVSEQAMSSLACRYGLKNGRDRLLDGVIGTATRFKKGYVPANKGKHDPKYGYEPTQFKKGHRPKNAKPIGTESLRSDGYVWVKVSEPRTWREKHRIIWEEANGQIPKGHVVLFADGNRQNFSLDNLILVSNAQLAMLNGKGLRHNNADLTKTGIMIADLYLKISERKKNKGKKMKPRKLISQKAINKRQRKLTKAQIRG